jgi:hypothetical protein
MIPTLTLLLAAIGDPSPIQSQLPGATSQPQTVRPPTEVRRPPETREPLPEIRRPPPPQPFEVPAGVIPYLHPGLVSYRGGRWVGTDHLFNMTENIGVYVLIVKPEQFESTLTEANIQRNVEDIFRTGRINPRAFTLPGQPPLPLFLIQILLHPIPEGVAAGCAISLFEAVDPQRVFLERDTAFQAITWQRAAMLISPKATSTEDITMKINEIAEEFVNIFNRYRILRR